MKRFLLAIFIIITSISAQSQIKKGSHYLGTQLSYMSGKNDYNTQDQRTKSALLGASVGKFIRENQVAGVQFSYSSGNSVVEDNGVTLSENKSKAFEAGVFLRQYKKLAKDFYFYGQGDLSFRTGKLTNKYSNPTSGNEVLNSGGYFSLSAGLSYQLFNHFYFEVGVPNVLLLQYIQSRQKISGLSPSDFKQSEFLFRSSLLSGNGLSTFGIGFRVIW